MIFFRNRKLKKIGEGVLPFLNYPNPNVNSLIRALELTIPIGFSNKKLFVIRSVGKVCDAKIVLDETRLMIWDLEVDGALAEFSSSVIVPLGGEGCYKIEQSDFKKLAENVDKFFREVCGITNFPNRDDYDFEMSWLSQSDLELAEKSWMKKVEGFSEKEERL